MLRVLSLEERRGERVCVRQEGNIHWNVLHPRNMTVNPRWAAEVETAEKSQHTYTQGMKGPKKCVQFLRQDSSHPQNCIL